MLTPIAVLKEVFGYESFRPLQAEVIEHALSGQDSLTIMPTGGGKSLCFQIPAIIKERLTLVVSPLISLMKDQVENLRSNGVPCAFYNSTLPEVDRLAIYQQAAQGQIKLLYLSPETLVNGIAWITQLDISLVAIDEAHCVSMWGHDFRPEYQQIGKLRNQLGDVPFVAFTATADKVTRTDIATQLRLRDPAVFVASFDRPNLFLSVRSQVPKQQKQQEIIHFIREREGESGILYCLSRKETENWSNFLNSQGFNARYYHAGLTASERSAIQEGFIHDHYSIICATIAFGMGIDKPNVRWVIHNNLPKNMESYYQEIGRAGRDGLKSDTVLYYNYRDVVMLNDFVQDSDFAAVYREKINRMLHYAEATTCRRQILLAYFGEHVGDDCGNCDICRNPPQFIDGTIIAQKALSAVIRSRESVGINLLIHVLRGAKTMEVFEKKLNLIKTYGLGAAHSFKAWQHFINQLINKGVLEIAYDKNMWLRVTSMGRAVLNDKQVVHLTDFVDKKNKLTTGGNRTTKKSAQQPLIAALKEWRLKKAKENTVPAYVIFNDVTLQQLVDIHPTHIKELTAVAGLGKVKIERFGSELIELLAQQSPKTTTYEKTWLLHRAGKSVDEIAGERKLSTQTVYNHLIKLAAEGKPIDLMHYISESEIQMVRSARATHDLSTLKSTYEALEGQLDYAKINLAVALLEQRKEQFK